MLPQPDGESRHKPQMQHEAVSPTRELWRLQDNRRGTPGSSERSLCRGEIKANKAGEEAGMREEGWAGILGRGRGRGEDTEARQSRAGWGPCQWLCREGPDQEESGFYPEAGE